MLLRTSKAMGLCLMLLPAVVLAQSRPHTHDGFFLRLESEPGFGFNAMVGKEWWVADDWGIGIAGQFIYCNVPGRFDTVSNSYAAGVLFSATYN